MAEFPALPLYTDAYIGDTQHLTNEEHGVYLRLLMFAWRTPDCALPDDDRRLALMVGVTPKKWGSLKPVIMSFWSLTEGTWKQKKLTAQREFVERSREQKRAAGIASSNAKSLKNNNEGSTAVVTEMPTEGQRNGQQNVNNPYPYPTIDNLSRKTGLRKSDETNSSEARKVAPKTDPIGREFEETFWPAYPRKVDRSDALKAFRKARVKVSIETVMAALKIFAAEMAGKDPQFIRHAARWLNACSWENALSAPNAETPQKWAQRLQGARRQRRWFTREWGPPPGATGCRVPNDLIEPGDGAGWSELEVAA